MNGIKNMESMNNKVLLVKNDKGYLLTIDGNKIQITEGQFNSLYSVLFIEHYQIEHKKMEEMKQSWIS